MINTAQDRLAALEQQLREIVPTWTMVPVMAAMCVVLQPRSS
jgi:hypothetical protein